MGSRYHEYNGIEYNGQMRAFLQRGYQCANKYVYFISVLISLQTREHLQYIIRCYHIALILIE